MNFYNEIDEGCCEHLRWLISKGLIPYGIVDSRSIVDIKPSELAGYTQCHFFAGLGGWSRALDLAGVPATTRLWTGSCPCQPFSQAGERAGFDDERHLWPFWHWLMQQCRPAIVLGEQVAGSLIDPWIDLVCADVEGLGYAFGAVAFPAAGIGAPHIRQRTYWVADTDNTGLEGWFKPGGKCEVEWSAGAGGVVGQRQPGEVNGYWSDADWIECGDGKWRGVAPGTFPLAHGVPGRVGRLRAYGNAIVPQQAAEFIRAVMS